MKTSHSLQKFELLTYQSFMRFLIIPIALCFLPLKALSISEDDCLENGGDFACMPTSTTEWDYWLCDNHNRPNGPGLWCLAYGMEPFPTGGCVGDPTEVTDANLTAVAETFVNLAYGRDDCSVSDDSGWGATSTATLCETGDAVYQNGVLVRDYRNLIFDSCNSEYIMVRKNRAVVCEEPGFVDVAGTCYLRTNGCKSGKWDENGACYVEPELGPPELPTSPCDDEASPSKGVGNPVNVTNGNKYQTEIDFSFGSSFSPLVLSRNYNSQDQTVGIFGRNWSTAFISKLTELQLYNSPTGAAQQATWVSFKTVRSKTGRRYRFEIQGSVYNQVTNSSATLTQENNLFIFKNERDETYRFDSDGKVLSVENANGLLTTYDYNANDQVDAISDRFGNSITLTYLNGFVETATVAGYGTYTYGYTNNLLTTVSFQSVEAGTSSVTKTYIYDDPNFDYLLTGIEDETGERFATWTYDAQGRAITSEHGDNGAEKVTLQYNASFRTTVRNAENKPRIYDFKFLQGRAQITKLEDSQSANCPLAMQYFTYDENGFLETAMSAEGAVTRYSHNSKGQLVFKQKGMTWADTNADNIVSVDELTASDSSQIIEQAWHPGYRVVDYKKLSGKGASGNWQDYRQTGALLDSYGRVRERTITDLTPFTSPYVTAGRTRTSTYTYAYYPSTAKVQTLTINGPRSPSEIDGGVDDVTVLHYNQQGLLTQVQNALNQSIFYSDFDSLGNPGEITDVNGVVTEIEYDFLGYLDTVTLVNPYEAVVTDYDYYPNGLLHKITLPDLSSLTFTYNAARQLTDIHNHLNERIELDPNLLNGDWTTRKVYTDQGVIWQTVERAYDELGRVMTLLGNDGQRTDLRYDKVGNLKDIDEQGHATLGTLETRHLYDTLGRLDQTTNAEQSVTQFTYDGQNALVGVTDARNNTTQFIVDGFGDTIQEISPDRGTTTYWYDKSGNLTQKLDDNDYTTTFTYDALSRIRTQTGGDGGVKTRVYDLTFGGHTYSIGRLSQIIESSSESTANHYYAYNVLGLISVSGQQVQRFGHNNSYRETRYLYSAGGYVTGIMYPGGRVVYYEYDRGQLEYVTTGYSYVAPLEYVIQSVAHWPFGVISEYQYDNGLTLNKTFDLDGRLDLLQLSDSSNNIIDLDYSYDASNNIDEIEDVNDTSRSQTFEYDAVHRLLKAWGLYGNMVYNYDAVGNRQTRTQTLNGQVFLQNNVLATQNNQIDFRSDYVNGVLSDSFSYTYDDAGNTYSITKNSATTDWNYNEFNRLSQVEEDNTPQANYIYNALGQRIHAHYPAAGEEVYSYDQFGRLLAITNNQNGNPLREYIYIGGEKVAMMFNAHGPLYASGPLELHNHLAFADQDSTSGSINVQYPGLSMSLSGNRWRYLDNPQTISSNTYLSFDFSADGNAEIHGIGVDESPSTLNSDRIFKLSGTQNFGITNYAYTGAGATQNISIPVGQHFTGQSMYIVLINDNDASPLNGQTTISNVRLCEGPCPPAPNGVQESGWVQTFYVHNDHLGTPKMMTDENKSIVWSADYTPFGELITGNEDVETSRFPGQYFDVATGMSYNYFRDYDPSLGRYLQSDPIGLRGGINTYAYVAGNPISLVDPYGLAPLEFDPFGKLADEVFDACKDKATCQAAYGACNAVCNYNTNCRMVCNDLYGPGIGLFCDGGGNLKVTKRGPKTDLNAPHNAKIREIGDQIEADGGAIIAGGGRKPERLIDTSGGNKSGRRPDVLYEDCNGNLCGVNVGKTKADGSPIKREQQALDDLNGAGLPTIFERYD